MIFISLTEVEIKKRLINKVNHRGVLQIPLYNFIVQEEEEMWGIEFTNAGTEMYVLKTKRGEKRKFKSFVGVVAWMRKMGINEFIVRLSKNTD